MSGSLWRVIAIVSLVGTALAIWWAWHDGIERSRSETLARIAGTRTAMRLTETPGASAWMQDLLQRHGEALGDEGDRYRAVLRLDEAPTFLRPLVGVLQHTQAGDATTQVTPLREDEWRPSPNDAGQRPLLRSITLHRVDDQVLAETRPTGRSTSPFVPSVAPLLCDAERALRSIALPSLPILGPMHVARVYAVAEDACFVSLRSSRTPEQSPLETARREAAEFERLPTSPTFASPPFFFRFHYDEPLTTQHLYSGPYLDLGGFGLVVTVAVPRDVNGTRSVLAADIRFEVDWDAFVSLVREPSAACVLPVSGDVGRQPWTALHQQCDEGTPREIVLALRELSFDERDRSAERSSVYSATLRDDTRALAVQNSASSWLLLVVPATPPKLPWIALLLTSSVLLGWIALVDRSRRRAEHERSKAQHALLEKQNLLETMEVPLVVVDPNTDVVVHSNGAAQALGLQSGSIFERTLVADDPLAIAHYRTMQANIDEPRRAYGVPLRAVNEDGKPAYGLVRSVAVRAPIDALHADRRHRLGIVFVVDEASDLDLWIRPKIQMACDDERARLASLLHHGLGHLAKVLAARPAGASDPTGQELARYLSHRIEALQWLFEHWDGPADSDARILIDARHVRHTLERHQSLYREAQGDTDLLRALHWSNGPLARADDAFTFSCDWSDDTAIALPAEGLFGFVLSEVLANAMAHGTSSAGVSLRLHESQQPSELSVTVRNAAHDGSVPEPRRARYGGLSLVQRVLEACRWPPMTIDVADDSFELTLRAPLLRRRDAGDAE